MKINFQRKFMEGHEIYSPFVLRLYDYLVLQFSNSFIWKCPTKEILSLYNRNVSASHLDIGVGTGYYLREADFPTETPNITLLDINNNSLKMAAKRIDYLSPKTVVADVLDDFHLEQKFDSASLCYILHCLSVDPKIKYKVFDNVARVVAGGGRVFGATIVSDLRRSSLAAHGLMHLYNKLGVFSNYNDTYDVLRNEFLDRFDYAHVTSIGSVVLFEGSVRK